MTFRTEGYLRRECFVTIGATAGFKALIDAVLAPKFLQTLSELQYTRLIIQAGPDMPHYHAVKPTSSETSYDIEVSAFDYNKTGLGEQMRGCQGKLPAVREGIVITHAGSGSILEALRVGVPFIMVPNPSLLDNHQTELAIEIENQGYGIHGELSDLASALRKNEQEAKSRTAWPTTQALDPSGRGLVGVMDEEMGYEARMRETLD